MRTSYTGLTIVDEEYLKSLEDFKKSMSYLPKIDEISYKDILRIDTYKESFIKLLETTRLSIANQRALDIGHETELMGGLNAIGHLIQNVKDIGNTRARYEEKKEEEKKRKEEEKKRKEMEASYTAR